MELLGLLLKSFGVLTLFYLVYKLILQKHTLFTAHRYFLISGLISAIVIPFITFTKKVTIVIPSQPTNHVPFYTFLDSSNTTPVIALSNPEINWWELLMVIYGLGILIMTIKVLLQLLSLYKLINSGTLVHKNRYSYIELDQEIAPFSFFSYIIYNPSTHTQEELKMILAHERIHAREFHSLDVFMAQILMILHWFNPIVWYYKHTLEQNLEYIADQKAIQQINNPIHYQRALVKVSSPSYEPALTNQFYQSFIKKRIIMLNTPKSHKRNLWKLGIVLPLLAIFMYSFNVKEITEYVEEDAAFAKENSASNTLNKTLPKALGTGTGDSDNQLEQSNNMKILDDDDNSNAVNKVLSSSSSKPLSVLNKKSENDNVSMKESSMRTAVLQENYRFKITKNTTIEELVTLKKMLKEKHNATLKYGNIDYNEAGEMTSIRLSFKDANGNNKNYNIQSNSPIADIYIYRDADGSTGMGNIASREEATERFDELREQMEERRDAMMDNRDSLRASMEDRRDEMRTRMEERREKMKLRGNTLRKKSDSLRKNLRINRDSLRMTLFSQKDSLKNWKRNYKDSIRIIQGKASSNLQKSGYLKLDNETYYYAYKGDGTLSYYDRWGTEIKKADPLYNKLKNVSSSSVSKNDGKDVRQTAISLLHSQSTVDKDPLILVNGTITTKAKMKQLDPNTIENVSVLKGKSAISIYGEKGKNGVIVIETKE